jgi:predicted nuclease of predicted toxin-antitoxin system
MKRLLLDECMDWRLKRYFSPEYEVRAVHEMGWQGVRNSELLQLASQAFDVLITVDKRLPEQKDLSQYSLSVVVIRAPNNRLATLAQAVPLIEAKLDALQAGETLVVAIDDRE